MKFWRYIGELLVFRWRVGKFRKSKREDDVPANGSSNSDKGDYDNGNYNNDDYDKGDYDDQDDLDDLDIYMRNNSVGEYGNNFRQSDDFSSRYNWNSGNYGQSFYDFHEEQDDFDMMDDYDMPDDF